MKFVDIKNDIAFRKIFGNEQKKEILISFLNAVLNPDSRIADVKILNPYQFARVKGAKTSIIDVKAVDENGHSYIVEMQVGEKSGLAKRIQYYASKTYSDQVSRGELYMQLRPVILIGIFDFNFLAGRNYLSNHVIMDKETGEHKLQDFDFHFIELSKFKKKADALKTLVDKWIFFIKESENLDVVPPHVDDKGLLAAYDESAKHNWSRQELADYDYISMRIGDEKAKLDFSYQKGIEITLTAIRHLQEGKKIQEVAKLTGLTAAQVKEIEEKLSKGS